MFRRFRIEGHSMEPRYKRGSSVLVRTTKRVRRGDVIAFHSGNNPKKVLIKRVCGEVAPNVFAVEGDNKEDSLDVGNVRRNEVIGKVIMHY